MAGFDGDAVAFGDQAPLDTVGARVVEGEAPAFLA